MPCLHLRNLVNGSIPTGSLIVIDSTKARAFDPDSDLLSDVIGVVYSNGDISYRAFSRGDGPDYYNLDITLWGEDLTAQIDENQNYILNPNYDDTFNPFGDTNKYSTILTSGVGPVVTAYTQVPPSWKLLQTNSTYDWYLIR